MGIFALWKLPSIVLTARLNIPFIATINATRTSQLKCLQTFSFLCLVKSPRKHTPLTHIMRRKGIALRILNVGIPWDYVVSFTASGKLPVTFAQKLAGSWYPEPTLTLCSAEKLSYPYRGSNPEQSVVQSLVLE